MRLDRPLKGNRIAEIGAELGSGEIDLVCS